MIQKFFHQERGLLTSADASKFLAPKGGEDHWVPGADDSDLIAGFSWHYVNWRQVNWIYNDIIFIHIYIYIMYIYIMYIYIYI